MSESHAPHGPQSSPASPQSSQALLDDRYGRGRRRRIDRRLGWVVAGALVLGGMVFLFFSDWQTANNVEFKTHSYQVVDDRTVTVDAQATIPAGSEGMCAFEALSPSFATVGWKLVPLPAIDEHARPVSATIVTTSAAATGTVRECWIVEAES